MLIIRNRSANSDSRQIVYSEKPRRNDFGRYGAITTEVISTQRGFHFFTEPRREMFNFSILLLAAAVLCCAMIHATAAAQIGSVAATVTRSAPGATLYSGGVLSPLRQGATLRPGDMIDTGLSGRVVMALGDGSQVVVFPGSRVELKDFQS